MEENTGKMVSCGNLNNRRIDSLLQLPDALLAHIVSFTIESTRDLARYRLVCKRFRDTVVPWTLTSRGGTKVTQCCFWNERSFVSILMSDQGNREESLLVGDRIDLSENFRIYPFGGDMFRLRHLMVLHLPSDDEEDSSDVEEITSEKGCNGETMKKEKCLSEEEERYLCQTILQSKSVDALQRCTKEAIRKGAFEPVCVSKNPPSPPSMNVVDDDMDSEFVTLPVLLSFEMEGDNSTYHEGDVIPLCLSDNMSLGFIFSDDDDDVSCLHRNQDLEGTFRGHVLRDDVDGTNRVWVLMWLRVDRDRMEYMSHLFEYTASLLYAELWEKKLSRSVTEGVAIVDGAVHVSLKQRLQEEVDALVTNSRVDYHPYSHNVVRDLVHPAMFPYVKGVSPILTNNTNSRGCDFWGRAYEESSKYQWLPTYFDVSVSGKCHIEDYINNLVPRSRYVGMYEALEGLFETLLPLFEVVYSYVRQVQPLIRRSPQEDESLEYDPDITDHLFTERPISLHGHKLQVITKIVEYDLSESSSLSYEGVWHVEGMSHEEIVMTGIYILQRDEDIQGGDLQFQRAFWKPEAERIYSEINQTRHPVLERIVQNGLAPLGSLATPEGRAIVFPNSHIHRVTTMERLVTTTIPSSSSSKRRIICFFVINPATRLVSTREVPPQQVEGGGTMTWEEAQCHRLELMKERKYTKQDWNVREIELCEH